jgi:hypothetical protein
MPNPKSFTLHSTQAVGWIPFFKQLKDLPQTNAYSDYAKLSWKNKKACDYLFFSGNEPDLTDSILSSSSDFDKFLDKSKNYRGALALRNIILTSNANNVKELFCETLPKGKSIGYTPYRNLISRSLKVFSYQKGVGGRGSEYEPSIRYDETGVYVTHTVLFRIGHIGNLAAKLLTGQFAPKMKMRVDYEIRHDGHYAVLFSGSYIPNQKWHLNGHGAWSHDMMKNKLHEIVSIFNANGKSSIAKGNYPSHKIDIL